MGWIVMDWNAIAWNEGIGKAWSRMESNGSGWDGMKLRMTGGIGIIWGPDGLQ